MICHAVSIQRKTARFADDTAMLTEAEKLVDD